MPKKSPLEYTTPAKALGDAEIASLRRNPPEHKARHENREDVTIWAIATVWEGRQRVGLAPHAHAYPSTLYPAPSPAEGELSVRWGAPGRAWYFAQYPEGNHIPPQDGYLG